MRFLPPTGIDTGLLSLFLWQASLAEWIEEDITCFEADRKYGEYKRDKSPLP